MTREVILLKEAMALYGLSPERAGRFLDVPGTTIRRWLRDDNDPSPVYLRAIREAVERMKSEFEPKIIEKGGAWFGTLSGDTPEPNPEAEAADEAAFKAEDELLARIAVAGAALKASASGPEGDQLGEAWGGFVRVAQALHERKINFRI